LLQIVNRLPDEIRDEKRKDHRGKNARNAKYDTEFIRFEICRKLPDFFHKKAQTALVMLKPQISVRCLYHANSSGNCQPTTIFEWNLNCFKAN
jgi:hypothetical protein